MQKSTYYILSAVEKKVSLSHSLLLAWCENPASPINNAELDVT